jgi:MFS family permease
VTTHLCIGSPYGWSILGDAITRQVGVVASATSDWTLAETAMPLSINFATLGLTAALAGSWQVRVGDTKALMAGSVCFGSGMALGALGIHLHSLPLLYGGYGLLGGIGVGLAYTPPIQALLSWFPDKKGLAAGLCIGGFGSAALIFGPLVSWLMSRFQILPKYIGNDASQISVSESGSLVTRLEDGTISEVVQVTARELVQLHCDGIQEGFYLAGTGDTGAAVALGVLAAGYFSLMMISSVLLKRPPAGYSLRFHSNNSPIQTRASSDPYVLQNGFVTFQNAVVTRQVIAMTTILFCIASGGIGLISVSKPMLTEVFGSILPEVITGSFASGFVMALSAANLSGRLGWGVISDVIGRRKTFWIFTASSIPLYLSIPFMVDQVVAFQSSAALYAFVGACFACISMMGGMYSLLPPYEADTFGSKYVGPIHGRVLLGTFGASLFGPLVLVKLRNNSEVFYINQLLESVDPMTFEARFGTPISNSWQLIESRALTIPKLMEIVPVGTLDPSPYIYNSAIYTISGLMVIALLAQASIRPVDSALIVRNHGK